MFRYHGDFICQEMVFDNGFILIVRYVQPADVGARPTGGWAERQTRRAFFVPQLPPLLAKSLILRLLRQLLLSAVWLKRLVRQAQKPVSPIMIERWGRQRAVGAALQPGEEIFGRYIENQAQSFDDFVAGQTFAFQEQ
jgi:hypothetical protein